MDNRNSKIRLVNRMGGALVILGILIFAGRLEAQSGLIPEKYLSISPGAATRGDVEKIYFKSDSTATFVDYAASDFSIGIKYSLGPCSLKLGTWGFPKWTVEEVFYDWPNDKKVPFEKIILDPTRFEKRNIGDVVGHSYFVNDEWGISVVYDEKLKSIDSIRLRPSAKLTEQYACRKK